MSRCGATSKQENGRAPLAWEQRALLLFLKIPLYLWDLYLQLYIPSGVTPT